MSGANTKNKSVPKSSLCQNELNFICSDLFPYINFSNYPVFENVRSSYPTNGAQLYVLPSWSIFGESYPEACRIMLEKIAEIHVIDSDFGLSRIRQTRAKRLSTSSLYERARNNSAFFMLPGQTDSGETKGKTLGELEREIEPKKYFLWGLYEGLVFALTHAKTLSDKNKHLELGGDIYRKKDGSAHSPVLSFVDGKIELSLRHRASKQSEVYFIPILHISD